MLVFLASCAGMISTAPPIDGHGYWSLTHTFLRIETISSMVNQFAAEHGKLPFDLDMIARESAAFDKPIKRTLLLDHWGRPYVYRLGGSGKQGFVLYSAGPDGIDNGGAADDVVDSSKEYNCAFYGACLTAKDYLHRAFAASAGCVLLAWFYLGVHALFPRAIRAKNAGDQLGPQSP